MEKNTNRIDSLQYLHTPFTITSPSQPKCLDLNKLKENCKKIAKSMRLQVVFIGLLTLRVNLPNKKFTRN